MADSTPDTQKPKVLTKPPPPLTKKQEDTVWKRRARQLIDDNLKTHARGATEENPEKTSRWRALWNYLKRLLSPRNESGSSAGEGESQEHSRSPSSPAGGDAPAAERSADKGKQRKSGFSMEDARELSVEDARELTAQLLDLIAAKPKYRDAYAKGRLPVLEMLLEKTDPKNAEKPAAKETEQPAPKGEAASVLGDQPPKGAKERFSREAVKGVADVSATLASSKDWTLATESTQPLESPEIPPESLRAFHANRFPGFDMNGSGRADPNSTGRPVSPVSLSTEQSVSRSSSKGPAKGRR
jgi:hypothetical protein